MYVLTLEASWTDYKQFNKLYYCENAKVLELKFRTIILKSFGTHREDIEKKLLAFATDKTEDGFWKLVACFEKEFRGTVLIKKIRPIKEDRVKEEFEKVYNKVIIKDIIE